ncbi:serine protease inhibitor 42Dd [Drosophila takahashii]|uniref:serine protease inhibitor 42Dd n=1 Tax=Drosophila takahashii TaxID=29030 RepID=UPI001CF89314|nr:serine protease inhibitor 42Dd [Drosophila takahashii]
MAIKATLLLLLTGYLLAAQTLAQDYNSWQREQQMRHFAQSPQLGPRSLASSNRRQQNNLPANNPPNNQNQEPLNLVEEVDMNKREPTTPPPPPTRPAPPNSYKERFSAKLFQKIVRTQGQRNVVFSPFSVHALLGLLYGVSDGKTARELQQFAGFSNNQLDVAQDFKRVIQLKEHLQAAELTVATRAYYNQQLSGVNPGFDNYAKFYFNAASEPVDMQNGKDTADRINVWVSDSTRGKIRELVGSSDIDSQTQALLVNAVYFKGRWEHEFAIMDTQPYEFRHTDGRTTPVAMMYNDDIYGLAELPELDATALELAYKDSETSMLIVLPNQPNGLANLEQQLSLPEFNLNQIAHRLRRQSVHVRLPKFQIEFEQDMTEPLKQLGIQQMFTPNSQVTKLLSAPVRVSKILQKAYIDVGEAGTEASAASYAKFVPLSLPPKPKEFIANRPFVFAIRTPNAVLFAGHVENPTPMTARNEPQPDGYNRN